MKKDIVTINRKLLDIANENVKSATPKYDAEEQRILNINSSVEMDDVKSLTRKLLQILEKESGPPSTTSQQDHRFPHASPTILKPTSNIKQEQHQSYDKLENSYDQPQDRRYNSPSEHKTWDTNFGSSKQFEQSSYPRHMPHQEDRMRLHPESRDYEENRLGLVDFHGMRKYVKVKFHNQETLFQSYNVFMRQAEQYGVFLNQIKDVTHDESSMYPKRVNGVTITLTRVRAMSNAIYNHLFDPNFVSDNYSVAKAALKRASNNLDGYLVLHQMLEPLHPRIGDSNVSIKLPTYEDSKDLDDLANSFINFFVYEELEKRTYSLREKLMKYIDTLPDTFEKAKSRINTILDTTPQSETLPQSLELSRLPITIERYMNQAGVSIPKTIPTIKTLNNTRSRTRDQKNLRNEATSDKQITKFSPRRIPKVDSMCSSCGMYGHKPDTCEITYKIINVNKWLDKANDENINTIVKFFRDKQKERRDKLISMTIKALSQPSMENSIILENDTDRVDFVNQHIIKILNHYENQTPTKDDDKSEVGSLSSDE